MSTDPEAAIRIKAEQQLTEHSSKYGQIMQVRILEHWYKHNLIHPYVF